ncbi:MAG: ArnT family glycosyltransferase [Planctomycetota bacterium]
MTQAARPSGRWGPLARGQWLALGAVTLLLYTFNLGGARVITDHEHLVLGPAKRSIQEGQWIVRHIGDRTLNEKPPLPVWAAAVGGTLGGGNEFAMRLPFALTGVAVVLLVAGLMARLFGRTIGLLSGWIQATVVYMGNHARLAEVEILLLFLVVAAIAVFLKLQSLAGEADRSRRWPWQLLFWLLVGMTNLCKGPLFGTVLILVACAGLPLLQRDWKRLALLWSPAGLALAAVVAAFWYVWAATIDPTAVDQWKAHFLDRAAGDLAAFNRPWWFYFTAWPWQLLPWTPFVLVGAAESLRRARRRKGAPDRFLWWWAGSLFTLLSLSGGKNHHYLIYALPAMTPVAAMGVRRALAAVRRRGPRMQRFARTCVWVLAPACLGAAVIISDRARPPQAALVLGGLTALGVAGVGVLALRRAAGRALAWTLACIAAAILTVQGWVLPSRDPRINDKRFLLSLPEEVLGAERLYACGGPRIAWYFFYVDRPLIGWEAADLKPHVAGGPIHVLAQRHYEERFAAFSRVTVVSESGGHPRRPPAQKLTLFRLEALE